MIREEEKFTLDDIPFLDPFFGEYDEWSQAELESELYDWEVVSNEGISN